MIGVGITTHNRRAIADVTVKQWRGLMPPNSKLVIVDDASDVPFPDATYRFDEVVGIARAKNKCLELLQDCEHIFLSDDDLYPTSPDWHTDYINAGVKHLCLTFDRLANGRPNGRCKLKERDGLTFWREPCGCLLYLHRDCLLSVGGFDTDFGRYGMEHVEYSNRVFNAGLTQWPFMDIANSLAKFYSFDYNCLTSSSVGDKSPFIKRVRHLFGAKRKNNHFIPFR
jgi:glycosyltransferase involved in cell wall biosynthesis